ncbi:MAG: putative signal transduction protein with EAL and GGDEF domain [Cellvibrionaceae bacterium]|jgi:predicted signal transduction protein with EAL and GGDEF domain
MWLNSNTETSLVHFGEVVADHRIMTIRPQGDTSQMTDSHEIDVLTGLGNRKMFERILDDSIGNNETCKLAIIMIDLAHFKRVNDTLGHLVGDRLLKLVANRLSKLIRSNAGLIDAKLIQFRLGGKRLPEFCFKFIVVFIKHLLFVTFFSTYMAFQLAIFTLLNIFEVT